MIGNRLKLASLMIPLCLGLAVQAEDTAAPEAAAAAAEPAAAAEAAPAAAPAKISPRPSEMAPRAVNNPLLKVANNGKHYIAVGARGHVLLSDDGTRWTQVAVPVDVLLTSVAFADAEHGWAVGHDASILATSDGGQTWKLQNYQPDLNKPLFDVLFLDAMHGFAVGAYGLFLTTADGGATWTQIEAPAITEGEKHFNALAKLGDGSLMVVGEAGLIGLSPDQGATWERIKSPYESSLFCLLPAGDKGALIGGLRGNSFWASEVKTANWTRIDTKTDQSLFGMAALPGEQIAMVGLNATLLIFDKTSNVRHVEIKDKNGNKQTDSLSWVTTAKNGEVVVVGDAGVQRLSTSAP